MTEKIAYKPVGGIVEAELFVVGGLNSAQDMVKGAGVSVSLMDDGSSYEESFTADGLPVSVVHTLTLCSDRNHAYPWFDEELLARAASEGVAARIRLSSGESLTLGWSEKFGFEQALRLRELRFESGQKPGHWPRVKLILTSHDTQSALRQ